MHLRHAKIEPIVAGAGRRSAAAFPILAFSVLAWLIAATTSCDNAKSPTIPTPTITPTLEVQDVQNLLAHAVEQAERLGVKASVAVLDREGNGLGVFEMTGPGAPGLAVSVTNPIVGAIAKARTAAYLSSNRHGFSTLTACFITRNHFPPNIGNTAAGPLFGVPRSSLGGSDIQPNNGAVAIVAGIGIIPLPGTGTEIGLTGVPGGVPIFKNGLLAGGLGVSTGVPNQAALDNILCCCGGVIPDEVIALGAVLGGYQVPDNLRGDGILLDGIRLLFANADPPQANFTLAFADLNSRGIMHVQPRPTPPARFLPTGEVNLGVIAGRNYDFRIKGSPRASGLTEAEVRRIIQQAADQAAKTRAAIRRPPGVPMQVFITVVDVDGQVLGIFRTPDATFFSYDVSAQKARTALAFSKPRGSLQVDASDTLGVMVRRLLGLAPDAGFAISARGVGFLAQDFYPPGISREEQSLGRDIGPGPFFNMPPGNGDEFIFQRNLRLRPYGNGITIFPGGVPLYKNGQLVGGIGISGDGVDQDDIVTFAGALGFEPPPEIRCDQFKFRDVRLPYVKFPRQPELR